MIELLKSHLSGYDINDIKRVVSNDNKQRFSIRDKNCVCEIRANQGHSIKEINELALRLVENPDFDIIHGTYSEHWQKIKSKGLSRMQRNHIHFSKGQNFICGLRKNADLFIYINFEKATTGNLKFFESDNGVILCAGNEQGILPAEYFEKVVTRHGDVIHP